MKNRVDEKKLTDYVLGELSPEETKEVERLIEDSAELRAEVEEIRSVTTLLTEGLAEEPVEGLAPDQKEEIRRQGRAPGHFWSYYKLAGGLVAACLVVAVYVNFPSLEREETFLQETSLNGTEVETSASSPEWGETSFKEGEANRLASTAASSGEKSDEARAGNELPTTATARVDSQPRGREDSKPSPQKVARTTSSLSSGEATDVREVEKTSQDPRVRDEGRIVGLDPSRAQSPKEIPQAPPGASPGSRMLALSKTSVPGGAVGGVVGGVVGGAYYADQPPQPAPDFNTETYDRITENEFIRVSEKPLSTFSIDVDTASYANLRRFLNQRELPPKDSIRIEELINYFDYDYVVPKDEHPFAAHIETASAPWNEKHLLVRFGLKGEEIDLSQRRAGNFVFLIDVSGSMRPANKLPLLKRALRLMVDNLNSEDRVAIAVYAGASGLVLPSTPCSDKEKILQALERLDAGGSTNGGAGIELAYRTAEEHILREGINRVILATDGDFNIGVTNQGDLTRLIEEKARSGVFLTVLGFGMGNYKDSTLEKLADKGNGNYSYIDTLQEARKVLVEEMGGTLVTIAKDVKIQVEFNPAEVQAYRLVGYENRLLRDQDFNDDTKDAGEIGAGHTVTVFYEVVPHGVEIDLSPAVDPLKYQRKPAVSSKEARDEMLTLKLRYKEPDGDKSKLIEVPVRASTGAFQKASEDFRFAASVAGFGMLLRDSAYKGSLDLNRLLELAEDSMGSDPHGYRKEFVSLVKKARAIGDLEELER